MARKRPQAHIYDDLNVTPDRLDAFAIAPRSDQVAVIARLRAQSADEGIAVKLGLSSSLIAILLVVIAPLLVIEVDTPLRTNPVFVAIVVIVVGAVLLAVFIPVMWDLARDQNRRERSTVWVGAFEDELARRHRLTGRAARRWQREH